MEVLTALLFLIGIGMAGAENNSITIQIIINTVGILSFAASLYLAYEMKNKPI